MLIIRNDVFDNGEVDFHDIEKYINEFANKYFPNLICAHIVNIYITDNFYRTQKSISTTVQQINVSTLGLHAYIDNEHRILLSSDLFNIFSETNMRNIYDEMFIEINAVIFHEFKHVEFSIKYAKSVRYINNDSILAYSLLEEAIVFDETFKNVENSYKKQVGAAAVVYDVLKNKELIKNKNDVYYFLYHFGIYVIIKDRKDNECENEYAFLSRYIINQCDSDIKSELDFMERMYKIVISDNSRYFSIGNFVSNALSNFYTYYNVN